MAKIPIRNDTGPARVNMTESILASIESKGLPAMTAGFPPIATAKRSEIAVSITKAIPIPTDHLPRRVFGIKSIFIYLYSIKKSPSRS